jgi:hypothetical protein
MVCCYQCNKNAFFSDTINPKRYTEQILAPLFENLSDDKKYWFFQQHSPTPHTVNNSVAALHTAWGQSN